MDSIERISGPTDAGPLRAPDYDRESGPADPDRRAGPQLSVVVPTFNEVDNVAELVERLRGALTGRRWEVIFVDDDSPDGTAQRLRAIAATDQRVRCIQRIGRRGLSSACVEGMLASSAPVIAVMDADLQHDAMLLPRMWDLLITDRLDLVVASRYAAGAAPGQWQPRRAALSRFATRLSRLVVRVELTDPLSGFFLIDRRLFDGSAHRLSVLGFKILLDLCASSARPLRVRELPYLFRARHAGESKLDSHAAWDFLMLLLDKLLGHLLPARLIAFLLIGTCGIALHVGAVALLLSLLRPFAQAQALAAVIVITFDYCINNALAYRDTRRSGWSLLRGWVGFMAVAAVGAVANVAVAVCLFRLRGAWLPAAIAGALVGTLWNHAAMALGSWGAPRGAVRQPLARRRAR